ncbi:acyltransferase [Streptomyces sp. 7-21]|jgi:peptidoglycan/LPS O-acetylase OafA/YrhL|uniref:acyltransferase family protein n=1 Tax=Streptomyces sp. 7-21 TaxID=2802283 RepID=UPI00191D7D3E|nr:acyltransferase [Streptomyces sp. 7-21]MBL1065246.1 acyltransferase [Streptomyces sp. 7-21]
MTYTDNVRTGEAPASRRTEPIVTPPAERTPPSRPAGQPRPRLRVLDGLRLVAALMVAVHHYVGTFRVNKPDSPWGRPVEEIFPNVFPLAAYGWIGVEFFFVISGFVICMSGWGKRPRDFFISRVTRLYPAYWLGVLVTTAVLMAYPVVREPPSYSEMLLNLSMLNEGFGVPGVDGVYWTLWSELRFYLLFLLVMATGLTYRKVVAFVCVWGTLSALAPAADFAALTLIINPEASWFFIAGLVLYLMHRFGPDALLWGILGMSWLLGQYQLVDRVAYESVSSWKGAVILYTVFLAVMAAVALGKLNRPRGRWLTTAGALTYPYYLIHYAIGLTAIYYLHDDINPRLLVSGLIVTGLLAAWLIHRLVERPAARLIKRELNRSFERLDAPRAADGKQSSASPAR